MTSLSKTHLNDIVLIAMPEEAESFQQWHNVFYTGIGKINAAYYTTKLLYKHNPQRVWNFGTAGAVDVPWGLHRVKSVVQYDMHLPAIGHDIGVTPYDECPSVLTLADSGVVCGTADLFATDYEGPEHVQIVDMEAYAIAKCIWHYNRCNNKNVEFICYKYVSNDLHEHAGTEWQQNAHTGEEYYKEQYERFHNKM